MGFKIRSVLRQFRMYDLPRQQHSARLPTKRAAPDHPVPELEIVSGAEIPADHFLKTTIPCQGALYDLFLRFRAELASLVINFCQSEKTVVTVIILILVLLFLFLHKLVISAHGNSAVHCPEIALFRNRKPAGMGKEHPGGVTVPHF